jgi:hypothetical protein
MTADTKLTPTERSANQGRSFAAAERTAYLSVVWRAVDVDGHGDELPPGPPVRPGGAVLGIPWVPVTVHSDTGTSLAPSRFNSTLYPSLVSWLTVSAADIPHKSWPLRQPSPLTDVSTTTAAAHVVVRRHIGAVATLSLHTSASIPSRATIGWCKAAAVRLSNGRN